MMSDCGDNAATSNKNIKNGKDNKVSLLVSSEMKSASALFRSCMDKYIASMTEIMVHAFKPLPAREHLAHFLLPISKNDLP